MEYNDRLILGKFGELPIPRRIEQREGTDSLMESLGRVY